MIQLLKKNLPCILILVAASPSMAQAKIDIQWDKQEMVSKSVATLQVVVNPPLRRGSAIHDQTFEALKNLGADYVRYVPWLPYPRLGVAELEPPSRQKTSWDFSLIDPMTIDFLQATKGHPVILNFSTIPEWMFKTDKPVSYPTNPDEVVWDYSQGTLLRDSSMHELANYYARLYSWYTQGGFKDELGKYHASGYHFDIPYWEVLNEPDLEHQPTPGQYAKEYDAITTAIRKISPHTKFVGLALAFETDPHWFEFFLNPKNHASAVPLDMISYHFYATSVSGQTIDDMQYTYFERADGFLNSVRYIENLRKRLSPHTRTTINEVGSILHNEDSIPDSYWNLSAALYAYLYLQLTRIGIDIIGESQLVGYPTQFPSVSMMNWKNGKPNARFWTLQLLKDHFGPGDILVQTGLENNINDAISSQGFKTKKGRFLLLINKRNKSYAVELPPSFKGKTISIVDESCGDRPAISSVISSTTIELRPFAVAVAGD